MAQRTFKTKTKPTEQHRFTIEGVGQLTGEPWSETFHALPTAPAVAMDDLTNSMGENAKGQLVWNQVSLIRFIRTVLVPDDTPRFDRLLADKDRAIDIYELGDVMLWLSELYAEVPTTPPSISDGGPGTAAATSTAS